MKKILSLSLVAVMAMVQPVMAQGDVKAKAVLEAVSKKINGLKTLKANFALHLSGANGKVKETKKGTFYMKGPKYRVEIAGQQIICDNKTCWTYMKE
jgi:outer membrane lipoprotein carrier protein